MSEDFKQWFDREWAAYLDTAFANKVTAGAWALKAWKYLSTPMHGGDARPTVIHLGRIETGDGTEACWKRNKDSLAYDWERGDPRLSGLTLDAIQAALP